MTEQMMTKCPFFPCSRPISIMQTKPIATLREHNTPAGVACPASFMSWPLSAAASQLLDELRKGHERQAGKPPAATTGDTADGMGPVGRPADGSDPGRYFPGRPADGPEPSYAGSRDRPLFVPPAVAGGPLGRQDSDVAGLRAGCNGLSVTLAEGQEAIRILNTKLTDVIVQITALRDPNGDTLGLPYVAAATHDLDKVQFYLQQAIEHIQTYARGL